MSQVAALTITPKGENSNILKKIEGQIKSKEDLNAEPNDSARKNPHTLQFKETYYRDFTPELRRITANTPRSKYERRSGFDKTTIHFGQRKLLLSEIEFLTLVANELHRADNRNRVVLVYAGAAPGLHTPMLTWMFPFISEFVLVDPAEFELDETKMRCKYRLIRECFTDKMAEQLRDEFAKDSSEVLLVSDIRTADHRELKSDETELRVEEDMAMQMKWHDIMKPYKSMFKFRLPYVGDNKSSKTSVEYLDGDIYFQIWEGKTSSETRLIVDRDAKRREYDCVWYEDTLFRFNTVERVLCYEHPIRVPGLDHCYDCRCEVHIFDEFVKAKSVISDLCEWRGLKKYEPPGETVTDMVNVINRLLNASRKTDAVKLTLDGKTHLYSVIFTDVYYGVDIKTLFNEDKIVQRRFLKYNSSDDDDDKADIVERNKSECRSIHTLECKHSEYKEVSHEEFGQMRILTNDYRERIKPKERYRMPDRTTIYYKERSLRLSEIEFLSLACSEIAENPGLVKFEHRIVLVYAGAGPSRGLEMLREMFPFLKIVVYEPRRFQFQVNTSSMLEVYHEYLNEQVALQLKEDYADYIRLFISNIKRADNFGTPENTRLEKEDLYLQMNIFRNLQPFKSMLRFRLPYPDERLGTKVESDYLEGTILFKLWSNCAHNEANLIVDAKPKMRTYSFMKFKNQLHRFNTVERCQLYTHDLSIDGIDHCYDCRGEVYVFQLYENKKDKIWAYFKCREKIALANKKRPIEEWISELNHLLDANNKKVSIQYNQNKYWIRFLGVRYGKTLDQVLDEVGKDIDNNNNNNNNSNINYRQYNNEDKRSELSRRLDFSSKAVR